MNPQNLEPTIEAFFHSTMSDLKAFAHREPVQAVAMAFGAGVLINLLPTRLVANSAGAVGATLLRPVLLTLGMIKVAELCCPKAKSSIPVPL